MIRHPNESPAAAHTTAAKQASPSPAADANVAMSPGILAAQSLSSQSNATLSQLPPHMPSNAPQPPLNRTRSSRTKWERLPGVGGGPPFVSQQLVSVRDASSKADVVVQVKVKMDKGFHFSSDCNHYCCFKRNLGEIASCYTVGPAPLQVPNPDGALVDPSITSASQLQICIPTPSNSESPSTNAGNDAHWLRCSSLHVSVKCLASGGELVPLVQRTPKRDRGPTLPVQPKPCQPNGSLVDLHDNTRTAVWERFQFSKATPAHYGPSCARKRAKPMATYVVVVELIARVQAGPGAAEEPEGNTSRDIVVAKATSEPFIVRSRSPGQYGAAVTVAAAGGSYLGAVRHARSGSAQLLTPNTTSHPEQSSLAMDVGGRHPSFRSRSITQESPPAQRERDPLHSAALQDSGTMIARPGDAQESDRHSTWGLQSRAPWIHSLDDPPPESIGTNTTGPPNSVPNQACLTSPLRFPARPGDVAMQEISRPHYPIQRPPFAYHYPHPAYQSNASNAYPSCPYPARGPSFYSAEEHAPQTVFYHSQERQHYPYEPPHSYPPFDAGPRPATYPEPYWHGPSGHMMPVHDPYAPQYSGLVPMHHSTAWVRDDRRFPHPHGYHPLQHPHHPPDHYVPHMDSDGLANAPTRAYPNHAPSIVHFPQPALHPARHPSQAYNGQGAHGGAGRTVEHESVFRRE